MKFISILSLLSIATFSWADANWQVVAESTHCAEKVKILAKEGEKFVYAVVGEDKTKLTSEDGSVFSETSGQSTVFSNTTEKSATSHFTYVQPSMVDNNSPKINVSINGSNDNCKMKLK
jgi:hypothetical protein